MLSNVRRKTIQKNIKKYSELKVNEWWDTKVGSGIFKYPISGKQRCSKKKMESSFENQNLAQDNKIPYYKIDGEIYNMILCPSGSFEKGHEEEDDNLPETMTIKKSFLLGETEITQEIYESVMNDNPSDFQEDSKYPVEKVSWYDAVMFCNRLSDIFDLDRYYTLTKGGKIVDTIEPKQDYVVGMDGDSKGFRLPTEWEWEYAAKADTPFLYSGSNNADEVGWHNDNSDKTTHPVKERNPNAWGFYDMSGNVWEWCENKYQSTSSNRVYRGGSWSCNTSLLLSVIRSTNSPSFRNNSLGFRVCRYI